MDIIKFIVFLSVLIVVIHIIKIFYFDIYVDLIKFPLFGVKAFFFPTFIVSIVRGTIVALANATIKPALLIILIYIVFYIIYIIIIDILIPALFIFIPLFELILKIPPFPQFIDLGVFLTIERIIVASGIKNVLLSWLKIYVALYLFSYNNIAIIFNYILPGLGDKIVEKMKYDDENNNDGDFKIEKIKEQEKEKEQENKEKENIRKQIEEETNICFLTNKKIITPDMSEGEIMNTEFQNNQIKINCNSDSITKYLKL